MIKISVKQKHIKAGMQGSCYWCPISQAIRDGLKIKEIAFVTTGEWSISVIDNKYKTPRSVVRFIRRFDELGKSAVKPFNFFLDKKYNPNIERNI